MSCAAVILYYVRLDISLKELDITINHSQQKSNAVNKHDYFEINMKRCKMKESNV